MKMNTLAMRKADNCKHLLNNLLIQEPRNVSYYPVSLDMATSSVDLQVNYVLGLQRFLVLSIIY